MEAVSMKIGTSSSFKTRQCVKCGKDAVIIIFHNDNEVHLCIEHYVERRDYADSNKNL